MTWLVLCEQTVKTCTTAQISINRFPFDRTWLIYEFLFLAFSAVSFFCEYDNFLIYKGCIMSFNGKKMLPLGNLFYLSFQPEIT